MEHEGDIVPLMIGAFGTVTKGSIKGLEDLEDEWRPCQLQNYWERPEYWEESWTLAETCCHSVSCERSSANTDVKNSQWVNNDNYDYSNNSNINYDNCNCKTRINCPMNVLCNLKNIVYQAIIFLKEKIKDKKTYAGISSVRWKQRYNNHIHLFSHMLEKLNSFIQTFIEVEK